MGRSAARGQVHDTSPVSERDLFWQWARAESDSERYGASFLGSLSGRLIARLDSNTWEGLDDADWTDIERAVLAIRGQYLSSLLELGVKWYSGKFMTSDLQDVRLIQYAPFLHVAPSRMMSEFVAELDGGNDPPGDPFGPHYRKVRSRFEPNRMRGSPILASETRTGPYLEVEGLMRMAILLSRLKRGEPVPPRITVMVGVCPRLPEWRWF